MSDLFGPITRVTLAYGLWVVPLAPLLAAAYALYAPLARAWRGRGKTGKSPAAASLDGAAANAAVLAAVVAFGWTAFATLRLSQLEDGERFLLEHVLRMVRVGQLDVALDLAFDPLTSVVALSASGAGLLLLIVARARGAGNTAFYGWSSLALGGTLLAVLADGLVLALVGWEIAAVAAWGLTKDARAFVVGRAADVGLLVGAATLFWGLGGVWVDGDYTPDLAPRFAAVHVAPSADADDARVFEPGEGAGFKVDEKTNKVEKLEDPDDKRRERALSGGKGELTLSSYPGALVFMDDSRTPLSSGDTPLRAPFARFPIDGGMHSFRIHPGAGLDDYVVAHVPLGKDREVALTVFGSTVNFREMRDQMLVARAPGVDAKEAKDEPSPRAALAAKTAFGGLGVVTLASLLVLVAAAGRSAQWPLHASLADLGGARPLAGGVVATTGALLGAYMMARLAFVVSLSPTACAVIALVGGVTAVAGAAAAARALDLRRVVACLGVSELGLAVMGAGSGAPGAAALELGVYAAGAAALWACVAAIEPARGADLRALGGLAQKAPTTARVWKFTAIALWVAPVPVLGGFWSKLQLLYMAFSSQGARVPGWAFFVLGGGATALGAYAVWRAYLLAFEGKSRAGAKDEADAKGEKSGKAKGASALDGASSAGLAAWLLCGAAALGGAVLAAGGALFGRAHAAGAQGAYPSLGGEWLAPISRGGLASFAPSSAPVAWGLAAVLAGAALAGWSAARARFGEKRRAGDLFPADAQRAPAEGASNGRRADAPGPARVAAGVERWVLDAAYAVVAGGARAAALALRAFDDRMLGAGIDALAERTARLDARNRAALALGGIAALAVALYLALHRAL